MLSARMAANAILAGSADKAPIWAVNIDDDYHEQEADAQQPVGGAAAAHAAA